MNITIFGCGYVGLVTAACFAELGNHVLCVDVDNLKVQQLAQGICPIYEPGLDILLQNNIAAQRLHFTSDATAAIAHGEIQFIAVGTPSDVDGSADLQYVLAVANTIGTYLQQPAIIVTKSTVPVGTSEQVRLAISNKLTERGCALNFSVASNPEFLKEGAAIQDFMQPDRIIIGTADTQTAQQLTQLYAPFATQQDRILLMDIPSAELSKYVANAMLATRISFMNEMSQIAERVGADIEAIRIAIGKDPRIGPHFLNAGCGYGGSCFPKDVRALRKTAYDLDYESKILAAVEDINHHQKQVLFLKIKKYFNDNLQNKTIALWGLAFKPNTNDMREAASHVLLQALWQAGVKVQAYDPAAQTEAFHLYGGRHDLQLCISKEHALEDADALVIVTEWAQFHSPDFQLIKQKLQYPVIFDGRNLYDPQRLRTLGIDYLAIGRSNLT